MTKLINFILPFCITTSVFSQPMPDSSSIAYKNLKTDAEKGHFLDSYFGKAPVADSAKTKNALALLSWFKKHKDEVGADYSQLFLANVLIFKSDYSTSLKLSLAVLPKFEARNDSNGIMVANDVIGLAYLSSKRYEKSIEYFKKVIPYAQGESSKRILSRTFNDIGIAYALSEKPDSGMIYAQKSVSLDKSLNNSSHISVSMSTLAENYIAASEYEIAIPFLRKAMNYNLKEKQYKNTYGILSVDNNFAQAFLGLNQHDSVTHYAKKSLQASVPLGYKEQAMRSYEYLFKSYEKTNQMDSVYKYYRLAMTVKDSLFSLEKINRLESMIFHEQIRQLEIEATKYEAKKKYQENIQLISIALGIILLIITFIILSSSYITNTTIIEYMGTLGLLVVFEYIYLLLHPFLENVTNHSPLLMFLALVLSAAILVPLHHKLEKWSTQKMLERNKTIRLSNAIKAFDQFEEK